jgi:hypothetical protein
MKCFGVWEFDLCFFVILVLFWFFLDFWEGGERQVRFFGGMGWLFWGVGVYYSYFAWWSFGLEADFWLEFLVFQEFERGEEDEFPRADISIRI